VGPGFLLGDGEGGHGEHDVAEQGGVVANLAVIQPEVVLAEPEVLLDRPPQARDPHQGDRGDRDGLGVVALTPAHPPEAKPGDATTG
jgi:hypothetical protein